VLTVSLAVTCCSWQSKQIINQVNIYIYAKYSNCVGISINFVHLSSTGLWLDTLARALLSPYNKIMWLEMVTSRIRNFC